MKSRTGKAISIPAGLGLSLIVSITITAIITGIFSVMLQNNTLIWKNIGYWIMAMLLLVSFVGGKTAINRIKSNKYLISVMSGILYWTFLLCITALFFGGQYSSVYETAILIIAGSMTASLLHLPSKPHLTKKYKSSYR